MEETVNSVPMLQTFRSVVVTNAEQVKYDVTASVSELNIFEDLYSNFLTGNIFYVDDHGGLNDIKFTGNEKLTIELYKSAEGQTVSTHEFAVYQVSDNIRVNDGTSAYMIHFISPEAITSKNTRCYSAITGACSEAVNQLFKMLDSTKALEVEQTAGNYKFVMPSLPPVECINWYAGRSLSTESGGSYFLFFETLNDGFRFKCVDTLVEVEPKFNYRYEPAGNTFLVKDVTNIREYEVYKVADTLNGYDELYTTLWNSDSVRKKIVKHRFDYDTDAKSSLNRGGSLVSSNSKNGFDQNLGDRRQAFGNQVIVRSESRSTHTQTDAYTYESIQPKLSAMRQYDGLRLRCLVFGNRDLQIGQTLNLTFMKTKMYDEESKANSTDETLSGNYLITAIRYVYKINSFEMSIEVVKDTREK